MVPKKTDEQKQTIANKSVYQNQKKQDSTAQTSEQSAEQPMFPIEMNVPPEVQEKLKEIKEKLDKFRKKIVEKFDKYIIGVALLPPPRPMPAEMAPQGKASTVGMLPPGPIAPQKIPMMGMPSTADYPQGMQGTMSTGNAQIQGPQAGDEKKIHALVLIDDSEPTKMTKYELLTKISQIVEVQAKEVDPEIKTNVYLLSEVWQSCYDGKYDLLQLVAMSAPVYDTGMMSAIKIAEIHKNKVLQKFEKYIVAYVLAGSLVQGKATKESDIDVFVVIDDTDVKKMTRLELKEKLRSIIIGLGIDAGEETGIRNKLNIQPYILTDFWDMMREANPVAFTFLRDGIPVYDRGIFMPWKQLLKMGKIKPSAEAIDMYLSSGEQMLDRVKVRMREIGIEDFFWSILTPSQAALMLYGLPPPTPKETPVVMREIFVKKEKLLENDDVDILEKVIDVRKKLEHGIKKDVTGKEIDELLENSEKYLKRIKRLFTQIEAIKEKESIIQLSNTALEAVRNVLLAEGMTAGADNTLASLFEEHITGKGKLPVAMGKTFNEILKARKEYDAGTLSKAEIESVRKDAEQFLRTVIEHIQRKKSRELDTRKIRIKYENKYSEVYVLNNEVYILQDLGAENKQVTKAPLLPGGGIGAQQSSTLQEFEHAIAEITFSRKPVIKESLFEDLKIIFGQGFEVLMG